MSFIEKSTLLDVCEQYWVLEVSEVSKTGGLHIAQGGAGALFEVQSLSAGAQGGWSLLLRSCPSVS